MGVALVVPAAGRGRRFGSKTPKTYVVIAGKPLLVHTLKRLLSAYPFDPVIVAVEAGRVGRVGALLRRWGLGRVIVVAGGASRAESVRNGLAALSGERLSGWVAVHDAARPLVDAGAVRRCIRDARRSGGAILAQACHATVKRSDATGRYIRRTEDRRTLYLAQTPQIFRVHELLSRYKKLGVSAWRRTDEASLFEGTGKRIALTPSDAFNLKITTREDLDFYTFYRRIKTGGVS